MNQIRNVYEKLYRSRTERMIAGVCGGLAEHFHIDPTWVRLVFIVLFFAGGCALLVYIIMWLIVPLAPITPHSNYVIK
jgi:phage shock protein C